MNKEQYKAQREELMNEAEGLIEEGNLEDSETKMNEVKDLDRRWEDVKVKNANLNALKEQQVSDINEKSEQVKGEQQVATIEEVKPMDENKLYENAWAKNMMGKSLNEDEQQVFNKVNTEFNNAFTHDTSNTGVLIPENVAAGIMKKAEDSYPLFADAKKFNVNGRLVLKKHESIDAGDADWYTEGTDTADEQNTFGEIILDGHELSKAVVVSWKLKAMAMDEFIPFIIDELGERVGVALGKAAAQGSGTGQPRGVETALLAQSGTPQVVTYDPEATTPDPLAYEDLTKAMSLVHSSYKNGLVIYANSNTIWNQLANLKDGQGRPLFINNVEANEVGRIFGVPVKEDAGVSDGSIIVGNANKGLVFNTNEPLSIVTEDHAKQRITDYVAYTVIDGDVIREDAFALIQNAPNA